MYFRHASFCGVFCGWLVGSVFFPLVSGGCFLLYTSLVKINYAEGADLWAAHSASIAVTRKTTICFIRNRMKWNACVHLHGHMSLDESSDPRCCHQCTRCKFHPHLGVQHLAVPWGVGAMGAPPEQQGRAHPTTPAKDQDRQGWKGSWRGRAGLLKAMSAPGRAWQHLSPQFHSEAK